MEIRQNYPQSQTLTNSSKIKLINELIYIADNFDIDIKNTIYLCAFNFLRGHNLLVENTNLSNKIINFLSDDSVIEINTSEERLFHNFIIKLIYQEPLQNFNLSEVLFQC
jgi:hypothetical protein